MGFLHLFIVNKSGGLIHHRPLGPKAPRIGTNEWLRIGSTFHSLHAIAAEASPLKLPGNKNASTFTTKSRYSRVLLDVLDESLGEFLQVRFVQIYKYSCSFKCYTAVGADDGIEQIQAGGMVLRCFQTRTGVKFVIT